MASECAVLFADLVGFTALTEAHGDVDAAGTARRFRQLAEESLASRARLVKLIGDAVMIQADSGDAAIATAGSLLAAVEAEPRYPAVRVGVHEGAVVDDDGDLFGATVNIAARLAGHAPVGQGLVTESLVPHAQSHPALEVRSLGEVLLKNVRAPMSVFAIELVDRERSIQVMDPVCRMLIDPDDAPGRLPWGGRVWYFCSWECASAFHDRPELHASADGHG